MELCADNTATQAYRRFQGSKASQSSEYDFTNYEAVFAVTVFFQCFRYILLLLSLKIRLARRMVFGSETVLLTLESVLPTGESGPSAIYKIWMLQTLI